MVPENRLALNAAVAAEMLGVSLPTLRQLTHRADFPAVKLGRRYIIPLASLQRWLDAQTAGTERGMQS